MCLINHSFVLNFRRQYRHQYESDDTHKAAPVLQNGLPQANRETELFAAVMHLMKGPKERNLCK